jgi:hypothetical protein
LSVPSRPVGVQGTCLPRASTCAIDVLSVAKHRSTGAPHHPHPCPAYAWLCPSRTLEPAPSPTRLREHHTFVVHIRLGLLLNLHSFILQTCCA